VGQVVQPLVGPRFPCHLSHSASLAGQM
jgi:hypothetical protein